MKRHAAFVLLEVMLGLAIFSIGVIVLGRSVSNCITAENARAEDQRARLALENRMGEIETGSVTLSDAQTQKLTGEFDGMTLTETQTALELKNENNQDLPGLYNIDLKVSWTSGQQPQLKELSFYVLRSQ